MSLESLDQVVVFDLGERRQETWDLRQWIKGNN